MKNSEIIKLHVLLNEFQQEYVDIDDLQLTSYFYEVENYVDSKLQYSLKEVEHTKL